MTMTMSAANNTFNLKNVLDKMRSSDKDFRFMAVNDLFANLNSTPSNSKLALIDVEDRLVDNLKHLIFDSNSEVQNLAIKCLPLVLTNITMKACTQLLGTINAVLLEAQPSKSSSSDQQRDMRAIACLCIQKILSSVEHGQTNVSQVVSAISNDLLVVLVQIVAPKNKAIDVPSNCLDILDLVTLLFTKFGHSPHSPDHKSYLECLLTLISSSEETPLSQNRNTSRRRAIPALAACAKTTPNWNDAIEAARHLIDVFSILVTTDSPSKQLTHSKVDSVRVILAGINAIAGSLGKPLEKDLEILVELLLGLAKVNPLPQQFGGSSSDDIELAGELHESIMVCFVALATNSRQCLIRGNTVNPELISLVSMCLDFDPNYAGNADCDMECDGESGGSDDNDDDEDDDEDDDDSSWKVRRAATRLVKAVFVRVDHTIPAGEKALLEKFAARLIAEREVMVKSEIVATLISIVKLDGGLSCLPAEKIVKACVRLLSSSSSATLQISLSLVSLITAITTRKPDLLTADRDLHLTLGKALISNIMGTSASLRKPLSKGVVSSIQIACIEFFFHTESFPQLDEMLKTVVKETLHRGVDPKGDFCVRVLTETLALGQKFVPDDATLPSVCLSLLSRFSEPEIRSRCLAFASTLLTRTPVDPSVKQSLLSRMLEMTDLPGTNTGRVQLEAINALSAALATDQANTDIRTSCMERLPGLLRKNQRSVRVAALQLAAVVGSPFDDQLAGPVLQELRNLMVDSDLHACALAVKALRCQLLNSPITSAGVEHIEPAILALCRSPLVHDTPVEAEIVVFLGDPCSGELRPIFVHDIFATLVNAQERLARPAVHCMAKTLSVVLNATIRTPATNGLIENWFNEVLQSGNSETQICFTLFLVGYLDLSGVNEPSIMTRFAGHFGIGSGSSSEEIRICAAFALARLAVADPDTHLTALLGELAKQSNKLNENQANDSPAVAFCLLDALSQFLSSRSASLSRHLSSPDFWALLATWANVQESGCRQLVADCLGSLSVFSTADSDDVVKLLAFVQNLASDPAKPNAQATACLAVKSIILSNHNTGKVSPELENLLSGVVVPLLSSSPSSPLVVQTCFSILTSLVHSDALFVSRCLAPASLLTIIQSACVESCGRGDLVRKVQMGPFTHVIDDGLALKLASFELLYNLVHKSIIGPATTPHPVLVAVTEAGVTALAQLNTQCEPGGLPVNPDVISLASQLVTEIVDRFGCATLVSTDEVTGPLATALAFVAAGVLPPQADKSSGSKANGTPSPAGHTASTQSSEDQIKRAAIKLGRRLFASFGCLSSSTSGQSFFVQRELIARGAPNVLVQFYNSLNGEIASTLTQDPEHHANTNGTTH